jgi:hypothetical protein
MINFLFQNKDLLILVRKIDMKSLTGNKFEIVKMVRKIFTKILLILEVMTKENPTTQNLMWKYKEDFIFEELGDIDQEGELDLVLVIINDSSDAIRYQQNKWTLSKTRQFTSSLNKRIKSQENFVLILEIYNKLIKYEASSFLKQSLIKMIMKRPEDIHSYGKETRRQFEKSQNFQEILFSIIRNNEMLFIREFLKKEFPLAGIFDEIEKSNECLNTIEKEDDSYDAQEYDELRDFQYIDLIKIYVELYLHPQYSDIKLKELVIIFTQLSLQYLKKLTKFNDEADFYDTNFKKSDLKYFMIYIKFFFSGLKRYREIQLDRKLRRGSKPDGDRFVDESSIDYSNPQTINKRIHEIDILNGDILERLEEAGDPRFEEIVNDIYHQDDEEFNISNNFSFS